MAHCRKSSRVIRAQLAAAIIAIGPLAGGCGGGAGSTGWRFGPAERPHRAARGEQREPEQISQQAMAPERVGETEPGEVGVVPERAARESRTVPPPEGGRGAGERVPTSVERTALRERALALLVEFARSGTPEERGNAIEALSMTPSRLTGLLEPALRSESAGLRAVAAMVTGKVRAKGLEGAVRPLVRDASPMVRAAAMFAQHRTGGGADLSPLADLLTSDDPRVRAQAAFVLGEIGEKSALGLLREAAMMRLPRANPLEVRVSDLQVSEARVKLGDDDALADVRAALFPARPEDLEAAAVACQIVGEVRDMGSANQLITLTLPTPDGGGPMPAEIRLAAAGSLAKLGRQPRNAAGVAREYINNPNEAIRAQAAQVIGHSRDTRLLTTLEAMFEDASGRVRVAAAAGAVRLTSP